MEQEYIHGVPTIEVVNKLTTWAARLRTDHNLFNGAWFYLWEVAAGNEGQEVHCG